LLVPVTDIDLKAGEYERIRKSSGDVVWIPAGRKSTLLNATADPERFIVVLFGTPARD
jgi:quercetin dioxygenase-like cupin family protein